MQVCMNCYHELFDFDKQCNICKSEQLLTTDEYKECKKFFMYHEKDVSKFSTHPYSTYLKYLNHKKKMEDLEDKRLHPQAGHIRTSISNNKITSQNKEQYVPKCPTCQSSDVRKIDLLERGISVATLGLFSKKINKSFKCKNCGYTW